MRLLPLTLVPLAVLLAVFLLTPQAAPVVVAQPAGWVELVGERTRTSKSFMDLSRPGVRLWEGSVAKVHYDGPDWKDIDNTLVPSLANVPTLGLVDMEMVTDDYEFYALQTLNTIPLWFYRNKSSPAQYVTFNPQALQWTNDLDDVDLISMPAIGTLGTVSGNRLHWEDAYGPGINLTLSAQAGRLAKALTLEAMPLPPAQYILDGGNPALEIQFIFRTPSGPDAPAIFVDGVEWGQSARTETVGAVEFRVGGETIFSFAEPTAFDSGFGIANPSFVLSKKGPNLRVAIRVPLGFLENATYPVVIDPTIDEQVGASGDDGRSHGGGFSSVETTLYVGFLGGGSTNVFARFTTVNIPAGATTIDVAYLTVEATATNLDGPGTYTEIYFEDADNPAAPTDKPSHDGRTRTTAFTNWSEVDFVVDTPTNSPSIVSVVQEVIDRGGWSANNAMQVLWDDSTGGGSQAYQLYSWDNTPAKAIQMHVEYTSWSNTAPTITNPISSETTNLDEAYARSFSATDPDTNQTLIWTLNSNASFLSVDGLNRTAYVNGTPDSMGDFYVNVTVGDEWNGNATDFVNFTLVVVTPVENFWGSSQGVTFVIGLIGMAILVILGIAFSPAIHMMAGMGGIFLAFVAYEGTTSPWITAMFALIGIVLILAGAFGIKMKRGL